MRPASLLAVACSAVLGVAVGIGAAVWLDRGDDTAADPLALGFPQVDQDCNGGYLLVVGMGGPSTLGASLASNPSARYLDTARSCETAWTGPGRPAPPWIAYLGPFETGTQACELRMSPEHRGTSVIRLQGGLTDVRHCLCYLDHRSMPTLRVGHQQTAVDTLWTRTLQNVLADLHRAPRTDADGVYDLTTATEVRDFQRDQTLDPTGVVDDTTWHALQNQGCPLYDQPSTNASP